MSAGTSTPSRDLINEVLAHNVNGPTDNVGERGAFIELFNSGNTDVDLSAFRLGTNSTTLSLWTFPLQAPS